MPLDLERRWVLPLVVGIAALVVRLLSLLASGGLHAVLGYDEGVYMGAATALVHGLLPYRDFVLVHPPGSTVLLAPFALLGRLTSEPTGWAAARLFVVGIGALNAALITVVARRVSVVAALVAGGVYVGWGPAVHVERTTMLEAFVLLALMVALTALRRPDETLWRVVLAGTALGLGVSVKLWGAVGLVVIAGWLLRHRAWRSAAVLVAAAVTTLGVVVAPFVALAGSRVFELTVLAQLSRGHGGAPLLDRPGLMFATDSVAGSSAHVATAAVVAGVVVLAVVAVARRRASRLWVALLLAQTGVLLVVPVYFAGYSSFIAPALALTVGAGVDVAVHDGPSPVVRRVSAAVALAGAVLLVLAGLVGVLRDGGLIARSDPHVAAVVSSARCVGSDSAGLLLMYGVLGRNIDRGCATVIDVDGTLYGVDPTNPSHATATARRRASGPYQQALRQYLAANDVVLIHRAVADAMSPQTRAALAARDVVVRSTGVKVYAGVAASGSPVRTPAVPWPSSVHGTLRDVRNVVLILADDLDWKLWNDIPRLKALQSQGTTLTNYVVSDSLCCPSRSTVFRAQYVHNHHVVSNDARTGGGWATFRDDGYPSDCLPTWLQAAGLRTGLVGKYLNGYPSNTVEAAHVPPGWDTFVVPTSGPAAYSGYDYTLDDNGTSRPYGHAPADFLNDVLTTKAADFIHAAGDRFFLELATFNPHLPSPVAPRHHGSHAGDRAPRDPSYDAAVTDPPTWLRSLPPLTARQSAHLDRTWIRRAESAESVADSVDAVRAALTATGHADDTLVIVTSDNGFHVGSYRTHRGKRTAYDTDTVVPAVLLGPGARPGKSVDQMTSETDLAPTISDLLSARTPAWVDGRSWLPLLRSSDPARVTWRTGTISESLSQPLPGDPDYQLIAPGTFVALHTRRWLYVESLGGGRELYDRSTDPAELHNLIGTAPRSIIDGLHRQLVALHQCSGRTCRAADLLPEPSPGAVLSRLSPRRS